MLKAKGRQGKNAAVQPPPQMIQGHACCPCSAVRVDLCLGSDDRQARKEGGREKRREGGKGRIKEKERKKRKGRKKEGKSVKKLGLFYITLVGRCT